MKIIITIWNTRSITGWDHRRRRGEIHPVVNTVAVRYPNANRVKGEPREIQEQFDIPCIREWDVNAKNMLGQNGAICNKPNHDKIRKIIERYEAMGEVTVIYNNPKHRP